MLSKITVYTKDNCGKCTFTKTTLKRLGVDFEEKNMDENHVYLQEAKDLGAQGAPFVVSGVVEPFSGFDAKKLEDIAKLV